MWKIWKKDILTTCRKCSPLEKKKKFSSPGVCYVKPMWGTAICMTAMPVQQGVNPRAWQRQSSASPRAAVAQSRAGAGCRLHGICTHATCGCTQKSQQAASRRNSLFSRVGRETQGTTQSNETFEKPFLSGRWRSEPQSGSKKKLLSAGCHSHSCARGAGVGVLGSMLRSGRWKRSSKACHSAGWACPSGMGNAKAKRHWTLCFFSPLGHLVLSKALHRSQWRALLKRLLSQYSSWLISWLKRKMFH